MVDIAYVLVLLGAAMIFRARMAPPVTWISFGALSAGVGGFLMHATFQTQEAMATMSGATNATMLLGC